MESRKCMSWLFCHSVTVLIIVYRRPSPPLPWPVHGEHARPSRWVTVFLFRVACSCCFYFSFTAPGPSFAWFRIAFSTSVGVHNLPPRWQVPRFGRETFCSVPKEPGLSRGCWFHGQREDDASGETSLCWWPNEDRKLYVVIFRVCSCLSASVSLWYNFLLIFPFGKKITKDFLSCLCPLFHQISLSSTPRVRSKHFTALRQVHLQTP